MPYQRAAITELRDLHQRLRLPLDATAEQIKALRQQIIDVLTPLGLDRAGIPPIESHTLLNTAPMTLLLWADDAAQRLAAYVVPNDQITAEQLEALERGSLPEVAAALAGPWQVFFADRLSDPTASPEWVDRKFTAAYAFAAGAPAAPGDPAG